MRKILFMLLLCSNALIGYASHPEVENNMFATMDNEEEKETVRKILEEICERCYGHMFSGRTYIQRSIYITDYTKTSTRIWAKGTHSYKGRFGASYLNQRFEVTLIRENSRSIKVHFRKAAKGPVSGDTYFMEDGYITIEDD
jgi:hypothetical protein